jgi:hypothetical protein
MDAKGCRAEQRVVLAEGGLQVLKPEIAPH